MFNLTDSAVKDILLNGDTKRNAVHLEGVLHTIDSDFKLDKIMNLITISDFVNKVGEEITIEFMFPMFEFNKFIVPNSDNLQLTLLINRGGELLERSYKLLLEDNDTKSPFHKDDKNNKQNYIQVRAQCVNLFLEAFRTISVSGSYQQTNLTEIINGEYEDTLKTLNTGEKVTPTLNVFRLDNERVYEQVILPNNTSILDLPVFLQQTDYGLYNGEVGVFLKDDVLYIYPLYNTARRNDVSCNIIHTNNPTFKTGEKTFKLKDKTLDIISDTSDAFRHPGESMATAQGVGFEYMDSDSVMGRSVNVQKTKAGTDPSKLRGGQSVLKKKDDTYLIKQLGPTNNLYRERGKLLKQNGGKLIVKWEFSDLDLLSPAMVGNYIFEEDDELQEYPTTLHKVITRIDNVSNTSVSNLEFFIGVKHV